MLEASDASSAVSLKQRNKLIESSIIVSLKNASLTNNFNQTVGCWFYIFILSLHDLLNIILLVSTSHYERIKILNFIEGTNISVIFFIVFH